MADIKKNLSFRPVVTIIYVTSLLLVCLVLVLIHPTWRLAFWRLSLPTYVIFLRSVFISTIFLNGVCSSVSQEDVHEFRRTLDVKTYQIDWLLRIKAHQKLDDCLAALWSQAGVVIFISCVSRGIFAFSCLIGGVLEFRRQEFASAAGFFTTSTILLATTLYILNPMADLTRSCTGKKNYSDSIIIKAAQHGAAEMPIETRCEYNSFMIHLDRTPVGIELPVVGTVNYAYLISWGRVLASGIPLAITACVSLAHRG